jgi:hypothetical protein
VTTPNITGGATESQKPRALRPNVVWRVETTLANLSTISSPIFDLLGDGFPYNELEVGAFSVVRVPGRRWSIACEITGGSVNMRLNIFHVQDAGSRQPQRVIYVPSLATGVESRPYRFNQTTRRVQFRLDNSPVGTGGGILTTIVLEVVNEG